MGRQRVIKPDFWTSEQVMALPRDARLFFIGVWNFSDDEGRFRWSPDSLRARICPGDSDVNAQLVQQWLSLIAHGGLVERYVSATGEHYGLVTGWHHQKINHPTPSKLPNPKTCRRVLPDGTFQDLDEPQAHAVTAPRALREDSLAINSIKPIQIKEEREARGARGENGLSLSFSPNGPGGEFGAETMRELFAATFRQLRGETPKLTGKGTDGLHDRVLEAAKARNADPRGLFVSRLHRWLQKDLKPIELAAPYACFAAEWAALSDAPAPVDAKTALFRKSMDALKRNDAETYEQCNRELEAMGGHSASK